MHTIKSGTMSENRGENQTSDVEENIRFVRSKNVEIPIRNYKKQNQQKELERVELLTQSQISQTASAIHGASQNTNITSSQSQSRIYKRPGIYKKDQATQTDEV